MNSSVLSQITTFTCKLYETKSGQMKYIITTLFFFGILTIEGQNLVNNPSFETYSRCGVMNVNDLSGLPNWHTIAPGTADYHHVCGDPNTGASVPNNWLGYQKPYDGHAYIGIFCFMKTVLSREYVQTRLISPLIAGQRYRISFFISLSDYSSFAVNNIGAVLSNDSINLRDSSSLGIFHLIPAINTTEIIYDTVNWTKVTGVYKANGGEQFLVLGNFYPDEKTSVELLMGTAGYSYYYIDAVSVIPLDATACTEFTVYPNPSEGIINIESACQTIEQIRIYSATGQLVKVIQGNTRSIDVRNLPAALYLLVATTVENKRLVKKIIKSN